MPDQLTDRARKAAEEMREIFQPQENCPAEAALPGSDCSCGQCDDWECRLLIDVATIVIKRHIEELFSGLQLTASQIDYLYARKAVPCPKK